MELAEYKAVVAGRLNSLPEEEQAVIAGIDGTPVGDILMKILGPEFLGGPKPKADSAAKQSQQPMPQTTAPKRKGLGAPI